MSLTNVWYLRAVADTSSKPCYICYKPTTGVLITPDNKDHFYICRGHLKDRGFCSAIVDEAETAAKKKKEEMDREIELVKREYEEKLKKRKKARDDKKDDKAEAKEKDKDKKREVEDGEDKKAEVEKDEKVGDLHNLLDKTIDSVTADQSH
ncbi:MAG: hypothetical protein Q9187_001477 [Circinaria calcarea]